MRRMLAATALAGLTVIGTASFASAQQPCDTYSTGCQPPGDTVKPRDKVKGVKHTLPKTGGEIVLLTLTGAGAVVIGAVLVTGVRRRLPATS